MDFIIIIINTGQTAQLMGPEYYIGKIRDVVLLIIYIISPIIILHTAMQLEDGLTTMCLWISKTQIPPL